MTLLRFDLTISNIVSWALEPASYLIYLAAVSVYMKKQARINIRPLACYFSIAFLLSSAILVTATTELQIPNIWLYELNALAAIVMLGLYFRNQFLTPLKKHTTTALITLVTVYLLIKNVVLQQFQLFDSIGYSFLSLSMIICVFMYFHQLLDNVSEQNIFDDFNFWLSSSFLIYFSGNFIIFLTYHYFTAKILATYTAEERDILTNLWGLHNCLLFVASLMLLFGSVWIVYRKRSVLS